MKKIISRFWKEYSFLSNFFLCHVEYEGVIYPSVEHAYQGAKTLDIEQRKLILKCSTPGKAKRFGRKFILREDWEDVKVSIMKDLLYSKFSNKELFSLLENTSDAILVEGNDWGDKFWGVSKNIDGSFYGQNKLGELLMKVRKNND